MIVYGIINKDGSAAVNVFGRLYVFRFKKEAKKIQLNKGEKIQKFELRPPLDGR